MAKDVAETAPQKPAPRHDTFDSLRKRVMRELGPGYTFGEVQVLRSIDVSPGIRIGGDRRFFEVVSKRFPAARVTVSEEKFYTQKEFAKKSREISDMIKKLAKNPKNPPPSAIDTLLEGPLPGYWYRDIGVSVSGMQTDESYPGMEKDVRESNKVVRKITGLLNPYDVPKLDTWTKVKH